jgi:hypothetical protein
MRVVRATLAVARWVFLVAALLIEAAWIASGWYCGSFGPTQHLVLSAGRGEALLLFDPEGIPAGIRRAKIQRYPRGPLEPWAWKPRLFRDPQDGTVDVRVPAWILLVLTATPAVVLWWPQVRAVRRRLAGRCPKCGYDRRGIAADAKCPECGTVP